jgi:hypothetical protein
MPYVSPQTNSNLFGWEKQAVSDSFAGAPLLHPAYFLLDEKESRQRNRPPACARREGIVVARLAADLA